MPAGLQVLLSKVKALLRQRRADEDLDREIQQHLAMLAERYLNHGLSVEEAWRAARQQFGGVTQMKEAIRERRGFPWVEELLQDG